MKNAYFEVCGILLSWSRSSCYVTMTLFCELCLCIYDMGEKHLVYLVHPSITFLLHENLVALDHIERVFSSHQGHRAMGNGVLWLTIPALSRHLKVYIRIHCMIMMTLMLIHFESCCFCR